MGNSAPANHAAQVLAEALVQGTANGHIDSSGRSWADRLKDCGYPANLVAFGSGEAVAAFSTTAPGGNASDALASMTSTQPGHQNGAQAPVPWACSGVGFASSTSGTVRHAWVIVVASAASSTACPQQVASMPASPSPSASASPSSSATSSPTATKTPTPIPSPTPGPVGVTVAFYPGWNLVVLPAGPVSAILFRAKGCYRAVYQQQGSQWLRYSPDVPPYANNLKTLNGGTYWVEGTAENCGLVQL